MSAREPAARDLAGEVASLLRPRDGHYRFESGHHGDRWLDLETLCFRVEPVRRLARTLADRLRAHEVDAVCGPLVEGAFVALLVAEELGLPFTYAAPAPEAGEGLFRVPYRIPASLRPPLAGKRVAIVNDVVSAGSAVRGAGTDLRACGALPVAVATLALFGTAAVEWAAAESLALEALATFPHSLWPPADCPLCRDGIPLSPPQPARVTL